MTELTGIVFGGETAGVDTQLGNLAIENNTIDFSNGANSVRIDTANTTVDMAKNDLTVNGADATFEEIAGSISNPTPETTAASSFLMLTEPVKETMQRSGADNPASERSILVDAELSTTVLPVKSSLLTVSPIRWAIIWSARLKPHLINFLPVSAASGNHSHQWRI